MKKITTLLIASVLIVTMMLTGCTTINKDAPQYKIYELAKENGYDESYDTWLIEFADGSIEFRLVNDDLNWKYTANDAWLDLFVLEEETPNWYDSLIAGEYGHTIEQNYSVEFNTLTEDVIETQILSPGSVATIPNDIFKDDYIFSGWYNGEVLFDFETQINSKTELTAKWLIDGIILEGFTAMENHHYLEVNNDVEEVDIETLILTDSEWVLSTTNNEDGEIESKIATLIEGDNKFFLISIGDVNKVYEINIKRLMMFEVTFTYEYTNKSQVKTEVVEYQENSLVTKYNYDIKGYTYEVDFDYSEKITNDTVITITYTPIEYTITFDVNGGRELEESSITVDFEGTAVLQTPIKDKHKFMGWKLSEIYFDEYKHEVDKNITLVAQWEKNSFEINYELFGAEQNLNNPTGFDLENVQLDLYDVEKIGYTFNGWYTDSKMTNEVAFIAANSTEDVLLYAKFTAKTYTITFNSDGGSNVGDLTVTYDQKYILPQPTKTDYVFAGWYLDDVLFTSGIWTIDNNVELIAKFDVYDYSITFIIPDGVLNESNYLGYNTGDTNVLNAPAEFIGYTFNGWYLDEDYTTKITTVTGKEENLTIYANFIANDYTVTLNNEGEKTSVVVTFDSEFEFDTPKKFGFKFIGWEYNEEILNNSLWDIAANVELIAKFEEYDYTITFDVESDNQTGYNANEEVTLSAGVNKVGYEFEGWYNGDDKIEVISTSTTGDLVLTAKYTPLEYTITFDTDGGFDLDDLVVTFDDNYILPEATRNGFEFIGWKYDNAEFEDGVWTFDADITIIAKWSIIDYTITYNLNGSDDDHGNVVTYTWEDEDIILLAASRQNDTFLGWYDNKGEVVQINKNSFGDIELTAEYDSFVYNLTYSFGIGTSNGDNPETYSYDDGTIELITPSSTNYDFSYWCFDATLTKKIIYLDHDFIKTLFDRELETTQLTARYTDEKMERQLFAGTDSRGMARTYVYFGSYPQTIVDDADTLTNLSALTTVNENGYYEYKGNEYAKIVTNASDSKYQYSNGEYVKIGEEQFFLVEYIKWRVMQNEDKTYYLLSENTLDVSEFKVDLTPGLDGETIINPNNYENSDLRNKLNSSFFEQAFNDIQVGFMNNTLGVNNEEFVSSLSYEDVHNVDLGFKDSAIDLSRYSLATDYAIACGVQIDTVSADLGAARYWLISGDENNSENVYRIDKDSFVNSVVCNSEVIGIRPTVSITF